MAATRRARVLYGATPRVDLLPDGPRAELRHDRIMPRLLIAILASAAVAALIGAVGLIPVALADQQLHALDEESNELVAEIAQHAETQQLISATGALAGERQRIAARDVLFMSLRDEVRDRLPDGVELIEFTGGTMVSDPEGSAASGESQDFGSLCPAEAATLTLRVTAPELAAVSTLIDRLAARTGFSCVVQTGIEEGGSDAGTTITLQLGVSDEMLSRRFEEVAP